LSNIKPTFTVRLSVTFSGKARNSTVTGYHCESSFPMLKQILFVLCFVFLCFNAWSQVDFSRFEYDWCKPHPRYKTQFAISNYETAFVPVSYEQSMQVTGYKTFYNLSLTTPPDSLVSADDLFQYYTNCFAGSVDSIIFKGPTLYCLRLYKKQTMMYVTVQYANGGKSYYLTVVEAARKPEQSMTADQMAMELAKNHPVTIWLTSARNDTTLREPDNKLLNEVVKCVRTHPNLNINIEAHTDNQGERSELISMSQQKARFVYKKLVSMGMARERGGYSGYGPAFPLENDNSHQALALNNRIVLTRKM